MAQEHQYAGTQRVTIVATEAITEKRFVTYDGKHTVDGKVAGVTNFSVDNAGFIGVQIVGIAVVEASGAISAGALVASDANGKAKSLTLSAVGDVEKIAGRAMEAASADGDFITVLLRPF
jgi:hypothetical protein